MLFNGGLGVIDGEVLIIGFYGFDPVAGNGSIIVLGAGLLHGY